MTASNKSIPLNKYFAELDADVAGIDKLLDTTYVYNATDVLVQTTWELPIVIQYPESKVHFEFCSNPGDISFGIVFVAAPEEGQDMNDLEIETVEEMGVVRSNLEAISGSFEVPCEGVVFFMWDNNFDWSSTKQISYCIEVTQPVFRFADQLRADKCRPLLAETVEDLNAAYVREADALDCIDHNTANVSFLEDQLHSLQKKLAARQKEKAALDAEIATLEGKVELATIAGPGLCIRLLNKRLLSTVLSYLDPEGGINLVCKYWAELAATQRQHAVTQPPAKLAPIGTHTLRRTKSEIKTDLAQIQAAKMLRELSRVQAAQAAQAVADSKVGSAAGSQVNSPSRTQLPSVGALNHAGSNKAGSAGTANGTATTVPSSASKADSKGAGAGEASAVSSMGGSNAAVAKDSRGGSKGKGRGTGRAPVRTTVAAGEVSDTSDSDEDSAAVAAAAAGTGTGSGKGSGKVGATRGSPGAGAGTGMADDAALLRTSSGRSNSNVRVSFDHMLPSPQAMVHTNSFTTKVPQVMSPPLPPGKKSGGERSNKHHPQLDPTPSPGRGEASKAEAAVQEGQGKRSSKGKDGASSPSGPAPELPLVAESKRRPRVKGAVKAPADGTAAPSAGKSGSKKAPKLPDNENSRNLLQHVKKVRSEQQLQAMVEYLNAGVVKVETNAQEKRRLKKLIKAWNASFEKKNGRLPNSAERSKGHLRELYEEYHQVSLALRIRQEKLEESLKAVGLTHEEFLQLRDKKISDW